MAEKSSMYSSIYLIILYVTTRKVPGFRAWHSSRVISHAAEGEVCVGLQHSWRSPVHCHGISPLGLSIYVLISWHWAVRPRCMTRDGPTKPAAMMDQHESRWGFCGYSSAIKILPANVQFLPIDLLLPLKHQLDLSAKHDNENCFCLILSQVYCNQTNYDIFKFHDIFHFLYEKT